MFNTQLLKCAEFAAQRQRQKAAFVPAGAGAPPGGMPPGAPPGMPPGMDPSMMGAPPGGMPPGMDPSMMGAPPGGMPPGPPPGAPPMDPAMGGDPAAAGGAPPPAAPPAPAPGGDIRSIIREELAALQGGQAGAGGAGGKPKGKKMDPEAAYQEALRTRKMLTHMYGLMGWGLPPDILDDGPAAQGGEQAAGGSGGASGGAPAGGEQKSAIAPIKPLETMTPALTTKAAEVSVFDKAEALLAIISEIR